ncbi:uncharacterized protein Z518_00658 [Rhinocladiella mackenziei CBS 650.93]|uniref:Rhinocladiella mackenziei CBS 650.93 unplaced genomic scaffold supercont1.1, whole genome shotgun sequence n=1 Tax=Rhinocladiella mackenziei CBS 650.93 TaxID=1442369 RepID=A0A0D2HG13_9EURO|nr:uncharacterized protein Z518_00658 [Rhinocladiella mackenziei CBS 650.93]KIX09578.1 hypothetical protein Z518_00658 [Rhinocladiella mackenziei CBS 650.93]
MSEKFLALVADVLGVPRESIDPDSGFVHNGGHSMAALRLAARCKADAVDVSVPTILKSSTINQLAELINSDAAQNQVVGYVSSPSPPSAPSWLPDKTAKELCEAPPSIQHASDLTEIQLTLIHGSLKSGNTNVIYHFQTYDSRDLPKIKQAWKTVIELEPIFRLHLDGDAQHASESAQGPEFDWQEVKFPSEDEARAALDPSLPGHPAWSATNSAGQNVEHPIVELISRFRVATYPNRSTGGSSSTVQWAVHHALIDGFAATLVFDKVRRAAAGEVITPGKSFSQLAAALNKYREAHRESGNAFWASKRPKAEEAMGELLLPRPTTDDPDHSSGYISVDTGIPSDVFKQISSISGATPAAMFYSAWAIVLSIYGDADVVCLGAVLAGRDLPLPHVAETVGPLMNTLPLYVKVRRDQTGIQFLQTVFDELVTLSSFQWTTPKNGYTRSFKSALAVQYDYLDDGSSSHSEKWPVTRQVTDIPLGVVVSSYGRIEFNYRKSDFYSKDVQNIAICYQTVLRSICRPGVTVEHCIQAASTVENQQLLRGYGNCCSGLTTRSSVVDDLVTLFESAAQKNPRGIAMEHMSETMTYEELDAAASRIAADLQPLIADGEVVCVNADGSMYWIVAIYGVLKAGGTYCALDATLPSKLRDDMYQSSGAKVFIVHTPDQEHLCPDTARHRLTVSTILNKSVGYSAWTPRANPEPRRTAYLCFTSGSTGKPKGVLCAHEGLVAFQRDLEVRLFAQPGQRIAQTMSVAFDGSIHEIFSALSYGATLVLKDPHDPFAHLRRVDATILTPTLASTLDPSDFLHLKTVYLVGEPVAQQVADVWGNATALYNMYGPTEATCGATIKRLLPKHAVTIGPPNPSTRIYILNRRRELLPPGVIGEIYLAGVQVARGYLGMTDTTKERFLPDTVCRGLDEFMYKTGDHGYWNDKGEVVYNGRKDRQIKLRGFRLDLGDLEARMLRADDSALAVAIAPCDDYLVAAVKPEVIDVVAFRRNVSGVLPPHALPRHIIPMAEFPKTKVGKLDYKAIAAAATARSERPSSELCGSTERRVAALWMLTLQLNPGTHIKADNNFSDLGGDSLSQLRLSFKLSREFGVKVPLPAIIESPTLRVLAGKIDTLRQLDKTIAADGGPMKACDLSPIEREWWSKYMLDKSSSAFNVSLVCTLDASVVDISRLGLAWNAVMARHPILRSRYVADVCSPAGVRRQFAAYAPQVQRLRSLDCWQEINRPFKLDRSPPIRVFMTNDRLIIVASHMICDLTTMQILLGEVSDVYERRGLQPILQSYTQCPLWKTPASECFLSFWSKYLNGVPETARYFLDPPARGDYRGTSFATLLPEQIWRNMVAFSLRKRVTMQQLALAAVSLALAPEDEEGHTDVILGVPHINRRSEEDLQTVGLFLEPLPVRVEYPPISLGSTLSGGKAEPPNNEDFLRVVQRSSQAAFGHAVSWNQLLDLMSIAPRYPNHPLLDAVVTFHDFSSQRSLRPRLAGVKPHYCWSEGSKFKIMVEWHAISDAHLAMRIEYDAACFTGASIDLICQRILHAMELLLSEKEYLSIKREIQSVTASSGGDNRPRLFGRLLDEL